MNESPERDLDELLSRHLRDRLEPRLGTAAATFRAERAAVARRRRWWIGSATGGAIAAGLALAWALQAGSPRPAVGPVARDAVAVAAATPTLTPVLESAAWSRVQDDGTRFVDDRPVRQFRRKVVEEVEWYDPRDGAVVRTTIPRQEIILIGLKTD